jgi:hypothetical protein
MYHFWLYNHKEKIIKMWGSIVLIINLWYTIKQTEKKKIFKKIPPKSFQKLGVCQVLTTKLIGKKRVLGAK